jgi:hypothetical protein
MMTKQRNGKDRTLRGTLAVLYAAGINGNGAGTSKEIGQGDVNDDETTDGKDRTSSTDDGMDPIYHPKK